MNKIFLVSVVLISFMLSGCYAHRYYFDGQKVMIEQKGIGAPSPNDPGGTYNGSVYGSYGWCNSDWNDYSQGRVNHVGQRLRDVGPPAPSNFQWWGR